MSHSAPRPRARRRRARSRTAVAAVAGGSAAVAALGWSVQSTTLLPQADLAVVRALRSEAFAGLAAAARAVTDLAATEAIVPTAAVAALALWALRQPRGALSVLLAVAVTQLAVAAVKGLVERGRPPDSVALADHAGYSFPSGHSASAMAVYGLLAVVAVRHVRGPLRIAACCGIAGLIAAVGATRVYLGAHYPTDVVAGWLLGALIAGSAWWLAGRAWRLPARPATA